MAVNICMMIKDLLRFITITDEELSTFQGMVFVSSHIREQPASKVDSEHHNKR